VGTVSGTSISFGTPVDFSTVAVDYPDVCIANGVVVIAYEKDASVCGKLYSIVEKTGATD
jgi:hypothetical protein